MMMEKTVLFRQPCGIGDIIFCQKIVKTFQVKGYKVLFPVKDNLMWLSDYMGFNFISENEVSTEQYDSSEIISEGNQLFYPLQDADRHYPAKRILEAKYRMVGLDYEDWCPYFTLNRNKEKENDLYFNTLGLKEGEKYYLVSENYGTPPNFLKHNIDIISSIPRRIDMTFYSKFTLFDWCKVIENATEIYMIDSAINYLIEKLSVKADKLLLYSRRPNFSEIDYVFRTKYTLCK